MRRRLTPKTGAVPVAASRARHERGAASLALVALLMLVTLWLAAFTARNLQVEQRSVTNVLRAATAFEAAEAGLAWAQAHLNAGQGVDDDCRSIAGPAAASFRNRFLALSPASGRFEPNGLEAGCVEADGGWSCRCDGPAPPGDGSMFSVRFLATELPGTVRLQAIGCSAGSHRCAHDAPPQTDALARHETTLALLSALPVAPLATVTSRGGFSSGNAALAVNNPDPATGLAIHAGGSIDAPGARIQGPAGTPQERTVSAHDAALASLSADAFFRRHFGASDAAWGRLPGVVPIRCDGDCGGAIEAAIADRADMTPVHVSGDLTISGPRAFGSSERPVLIVASGAVRLEGEVVLHGVLYGESIAWERPAPAALVRGALLTANGYSGAGTPTLIHDAALLSRLRLGSGGFAAVNGAWRDF